MPHDIPKPWDAFLMDLDRSLEEPVEPLAGIGSPLHKKHRVYVQLVTVLEAYPEDYEERLTEMFPGALRNAHPGIEVAVLEWGSFRTYDWRAGLHAAGSLLSYEKLSPALALSSPALLMRNTTDDPEWRSWIYHDHVSWFAGSGYVAQKLFRDYYAPRRHAFTSGTFKDIPRRAEFFDAISQMKPEDWTPNTVDAIATYTVAAIEIRANWPRDGEAPSTNPTCAARRGGRSPCLRRARRRGEMRRGQRLRSAPARRAPGGGSAG